MHVLGTTLAAAAEPDGWVPLPMPPVPANARILGVAEPGTPLGRMILVLRPDPAARAGLDRFLAAVQELRSPDYHQWLDPDAFGNRFGAVPAAVERVTGWLRDQGFAVEPVPRGRLAVVFSGTAAQVRQAFRTAIVRCAWGGAVHLAATVPPAVPAELADAVEGLAALRPAPAQPLHGFREPLPARRGLTLFGLHLLAPGDFAIIYNTRPLLDRGVDGTGTAVAILSRNRLGADQYGGAGPAVFHDVQAGNNTVPGTPGYPCGPAYDQATGLGSVDAAALAEAWPRAAGRPQGAAENAASPQAKHAPP